MISKLVKALKDNAERRERELKLIQDPIDILIEAENYLIFMDEFNYKVSDIAAVLFKIDVVIQELESWKEAIK